MCLFRFNAKDARPCLHCLGELSRRSFTLLLLCWSEPLPVTTKEKITRFVGRLENVVADLSEQAVPVNTRKGTNAKVSLFEAFSKKQNVVINRTTCSAADMKKALCQVFRQRAVQRLTAGCRNRSGPFNLFISEAFTGGIVRWTKL